MNEQLVLAGVRQLKLTDAAEKLNKQLQAEILVRKTAEEALSVLNERLAVELAAARRLQQTSTLLIVGGDIDALYQQILDAGIAIMRADMASLQMVDENEDALRMLASRGFDEAFEWNRRGRKTAWALARSEGQRVVVPDVEKCAYIVGTPALDDYRKAGIRAVQSTPLVSRSGQLIGIISTHWRAPHHPTEGELRLFDVLARQATDLIERKRVEEALSHAQGQLADHTGRLEDAVAERTSKLQETVWELESFSYSITHDLRAPLRALEGFSAILGANYGNQLDEAGKDFLRRIGHAATRMDKLIVDVLNYSRVLRQDLRLETVNVQQLLQGMLGSYPDFHAANIDVAIEGELSAVLGNEAALTQCFSNLLNNAIKFVPAGTNPRVRISAERRGEMVRFWVNDNGIGIADPYRDIIFGMFQRLDTAYPGTGIGLAIVRKTVERMGGQVGVESEPGQGSRFWLELKAAKQEALS